MELLTKGEVTVTFKSQHGVVSEFRVLDDSYHGWNSKFWDQIVSGEITPGANAGSFSTGDNLAIEGKTFKVIMVGGGVLQVAPIENFFNTYKKGNQSFSVQHTYVDDYASRAERRAAMFARRTKTDGWNSHGKGLARGKQYYKSQKAGHY